MSSEVTFLTSSGIKAQILGPSHQTDFNPYLGWFVIKGQSYLHGFFEFIEFFRLCVRYKEKVIK